MASFSFSARSPRSHRQQSGTTATKSRMKRAVLLMSAAMACGLVAAQVHAEGVHHHHQLADRQLVRSLQAASVNVHHRRQANQTDADTSLTNSASTSDGVASSTATTTPVQPSEGSSTTTLPPVSSTGVDTTSTTLQTTTSGGEVSTSETTTTLSTTTLPTTTTLPPTTSSDTTTSTSESSQAGITTIITTTLDDGSVQTTASTAAATSASSDSDDEPSNHKAWIIPLSVVAGIIALSGFLFLGYRCTQRRFSEIDDEDDNGIRWPELMQRHGEEGTTLNPLATKRREGAGFDMDEDKNVSQLDLVDHDGLSSYARGTPNPSHAEVFGNAGLGAPAMAMARTASSGGSSNGGSTPGGGYYGAPNAYYDPYLGASGAPYPPPPRVISPNQQAYYDPYQDNPDYAPASPYYPPPSRNANSTGRSSPYQGSVRAASPAIGNQATVANGGPVPISSPYAEYEDTFFPSADPSPAVASNGARASPPLPQGQTAPRQPMRLSIANPDGLVDH